MRLFAIWVILILAGCGGNHGSDRDVSNNNGEGMMEVPDTGDPGAEDVAPGQDVSEDTPTVEEDHPPLDYSDDQMWACLPGVEGDPCARALTVEDRPASGPEERFDLPLPASDANVDCFYVYPTVTLGTEPGNVEDFENLPHILDFITMQLLPLRDLCRTFVPLYRQATLSSYGTTRQDPTLEYAYVDVAAAFERYLEHHAQGRDFFLIGHSQGSHMLRRLMQRVIDEDDSLRQRLRAAILLGPLGDVVVPQGELVGGSFQNIPLCSSEDERGCVITFNTFGEPVPPGALYGFGFGVGEGEDVACTNPAALGGKGTVRGGHFLVDWNHDEVAAIFGLEFVESEADFVRVPDFYEVECRQNPLGRSYLHLSVAPSENDERVDPLPYDDLHGSLKFGLHMVEGGLLVEDIRRQMESRL